MVNFCGKGRTLGKPWLLMRVKDDAALLEARLLVQGSPLCVRHSVLFEENGFVCGNMPSALYVTEYCFYL